MSVEHDHALVPYSYEYPRPALTVDTVLFAMREEDLAVLVIRRKKNPFRGAWALPGGFVDESEGLKNAALRELAEETGVSGVRIEQLGAFGDPGRDPRGHTVSVVYFGFVVAEAHPVSAGDDAAEVAWIPVKDFREGGEKLAFDHERIVQKARRRLRERLDDPRRFSAFELVPPRFTLTELQKVYEAVFARTLDKRNFRAKLAAHRLVEPVAAERRGRHRPAQLYRFRSVRAPRGRS